MNYSVYLLQRGFLIRVAEKLNNYMLIVKRGGRTQISHIKLSQNVASESKDIGQKSEGTPLVSAAYFYFLMLQILLRIPSRFYYGWKNMLCEL